MTAPKPKLWSDPLPVPASVRSALVEYSPTIAQLLVARGITTADAAHSFFEGRAPELDDPQALLGMPQTVERLRSAIQRGERIAVYGDYDTDGVTATALLVQVLGALGAQVQPYIPERESEGYGLNHEALRTLKDAGVKVVVTVDCGIRSLAEADTARELGLDLIISDHHHPGPELPAAFAVVNPKQAGDPYPYKDLAGVGLAYKIAQGLIRPMQPRPAFHAGLVLDLVALGTVADLAPLTGENRYLVRSGLTVINKPRREGLKALLLLARVKPGEANATTIGFALGPRLNAAGRLESALAAYQLLTTADVAEAGQLAGQLEQQNRDRQALTRETQLRARELALAEHPDAALLFAAAPEFRGGVVGLAAARLADEFYRPAIVATQGPDLTRGSARSIKEFHITEALDQCRDMLEKYGGHAAAAGFTVQTARVPELAERLRQIAEAQLGGLELQPTLAVDAFVTLPELMADDLYRQLQLFEPCGYGNPAPVLATRDVRVTAERTVGADAKHLKLTLSDGRVTVDAIAFNQGHWHNRLPPRVDVAYHLEMNEWNGQKRLQLNVRDVRPGIV